MSAGYLQTEIHQQHFNDVAGFAYQNHIKRNPNSGGRINIVGGRGVKLDDTKDGKVENPAPVYPTK